MSVPHPRSHERKRARRMVADDRRQQLLDVAVKVFAARGYERASVADVCEQAKIGRGTFYEYFDSKHALFRALLGAHAQRLAGDMQPFHRQREGRLVDGTARDLLTARFRSIFASFRANRHVYAIFLKETMAKNAETEDLFRLIQEQQIALVADELRHAMGSGWIRPHQDPRLLATFLLGGVMHVAFRYIIDPVEPGADDVDLDALAASAAEMALAGLMLPAKTPR